MGDVRLGQNTENAPSGRPESVAIRAVLLCQPRFRGTHHGLVQKTSEIDLLGTS